MKRGNTLSEPTTPRRGNSSRGSDLRVLASLEYAKADVILVRYDWLAAAVGQDETVDFVRLEIESPIVIGSLEAREYIDRKFVTVK